VPRAYEAQLQAGSAGDLYGFWGLPLDGDAARRREAKGHELLGDMVGFRKIEAAEKAEGEWNTYEITLDGPSLVVLVNGKRVNEAKARPSCRDASRCSPKAARSTSGGSRSGPFPPDSASAMNTDLPAGVRLDTGRGGLPRLSIDTDTCAAELYLHGAHLCRWQPRSHPHPVLWMSEKSRFEAGAPIRGGVPVCFPWFGPRAGDPSAPVHGVARTSLWSLDSAALEPGGPVVVRLSLSIDARAHPSVADAVALSYELRLGRSLAMALTATNPGEAPITIEEALHTYLSVSDVRRVSVEASGARPIWTRSMARRARRRRRT